MTSLDDKFFSVRNTTRMALCIALICVSAYIAIPVPFMAPLTMQTFVMCLAALVLTPRQTAVVLIGYTVLGMSAHQRGLDKLEANPAALAADLDATWELLAEPIQTVMRRYGIANPYEKLKELTRGKPHLDATTIRAFIDTLDIPEDAKARLLVLTPATYTGKAEALARRI